MALVLGIAILAICFIFSAFLSNIIIGMAGFTSVEDMMGSRGGRYLYRGIQGLANIISWGLPAVLWASYVGGYKAHLGLGEKPRGDLLGLAALITICALPAVEGMIIPKDGSFLPEGLREVEDWARSQEQSMSGTLVTLLSDTSFWGLSTNVLIIAIVPAIAEELFFRGFLLGVLRRMVGLHGAVWIGAMFFSLVHFQFYGFFARVVLGAILGYLYLWSGDLKTAMFAHFVHNLMNLVLAVLALKGFINQDILNSNFQFGPVVIVLSATMSVGLLYVYWRRNRTLELDLSDE